MQVKLLKAHYHANQLYLADDILEVESHTAHWLVEHGVAQFVKTERQKVVKEQDDA